MGMAVMEEKQLFRLLNGAKRNYNTLEWCDERHPALLCYFKEQIKSIIESYDEIESNNSSLSQKLAEDIRTFIHDIDLSFFTRYKEFFCNTTEEHIAIESIFDVVDEFHYLYPLENKNKHQHKASKTLQASNGLPEELPTDEAKNILEAAVNAGLLTEIPGTNQYNWEGTKRLLVYFILKANTELDYIYEVINSQGNKEIRQKWSKWKMITKAKGKDFANTKLTEELSNVKTLNGGYKLPKDAKIVDDAYNWNRKELKL